MKFLTTLTAALMALSLSQPAFAANQTASKAAKKQQAETQFIVLDVYKDGKIDIATWLKSGRTAKDFKRADKNKDGVIDKQEFIVAQAFCC